MNLFREQLFVITASWIGHKQDCKNCTPPIYKTLRLVGNADNISTSKYTVAIRNQIDFSKERYHSSCLNRQ